MQSRGGTEAKEMTHFLQRDSGRDWGRGRDLRNSQQVGDRGLCHRISAGHRRQSEACGGQDVASLQDQGQTSIRGWPRQRVIKRITIVHTFLLVFL
jgi:hypothetical protein